LVALLLFASFAAPAAANEKYAAIVFDVNSGETLFARNADARRFPASLTKMMTLYILFEELEAGRLQLDSRLSVSRNAATQAPSKLGIRAGSTIEVEEAILGLVTKSANDVAVAVAENIGGSVSDFAGRMTRTARALDMTGTTFRNPHGLPNSAQVTTARDFVRLAIALQDRFPGYYDYFSKRSFTYRGHRYRNHNRLLGSVQGVDGIKTGYTRASGFNLVTNVRRDGRHIVAVVMGGRTASSRDAHMRELIAEYLSKASRGSRSTPLLVAGTGEAGLFVDADVRMPRPRPADETEPMLAYAAATTPRDVVSAAMAEAAPARIPAPGDLPPAAPSAATVEARADVIAERIDTATEVAELVPDIAAEADDPIARLTELARVRSGEQDIVAAGAAGDSDDAGSDSGGWHIQIGAVETVDDAEALLERAQESMGPVLAALYPFTQEIDHNGTILYRARFAGFSDKDEARATCDKLKSKSFACLAVSN
jgi:D-alanyl-D-alanine carboxypeptidase